MRHDTRQVFRPDNIVCLLTLRSSKKVHKLCKYWFSKNYTVLSFTKRRNDLSFERLIKICHVKWQTSCKPAEVVDKVLRTPINRTRIYNDHGKRGQMNNSKFLSLQDTWWSATPQTCKDLKPDKIPIWN